jgi:hypothetical protein
VRPATEINIPDVLRCIDGPLPSVRHIGLGELPYSGRTVLLADVWIERCARACVLSSNNLADIAVGQLPKQVTACQDLPRPAGGAVSRSLDLAHRAEPCPYRAAVVLQPAQLCEQLASLRVHGLRRYRPRQ